MVSSGGRSCVLSRSAQFVQMMKVGVFANTFTCGELVLQLLKVAGRIAIFALLIECHRLVEKFFFGNAHDEEVGCAKAANHQGRRQDDGDHEPCALRALAGA